MKKTVCILMALALLLGLCACGAKPEAPEAPETGEEEIKEWSRRGYFTNDNDELVTIMWMEDADEPGWYIGVMIGETMTGWYVEQVGNSLHGNLNAWDESAEPYVVTVSEEGEDGIVLEVEGGESYHFTAFEVPKATIFVSVNVDGMGIIGYNEGEEAPEMDPEYPFQSAQINIAEPAVYTLAAMPQAGNLFVKWTRNGEDFTDEPQFTVLFDESADFVAVFEEDPDWQNPVMNFIGEYQSGRAHALVECWDKQDA